MFYEQSSVYDAQVPYTCVVVLYGKTKTTICAAVAIERTCEQPINVCLLTCCVGYKRVVGSIKRTVGYIGVSVPIAPKMILERMSAVVRLTAEILVLL